MGCVISLPLAFARGQEAPRTECPVANGLFIQTSADSAARRSPDAPAREGLRVDARQAIDTVWTFNISERRWTRPFFSALIGAGWASGARRTGTTTAPASFDAGAWSACAGARIDMREPTLVLRGARGQVHLRADVRALSRMGRRDTTSQPRR
jgi:hypothetical protein